MTKEERKAVVKLRCACNQFCTRDEEDEYKCCFDGQNYDCYDEDWDKERTSQPQVINIATL